MKEVNPKAIIYDHYEPGKQRRLASNLYFTHSCSIDELGSAGSRGLASIKEVVSLYRERTAASKDDTNRYVTDHSTPSHLDSQHHQLFTRS